MRHSYAKGHPYHPPHHDARGMHAPRRNQARELARLLDDLVDFDDIVRRMLSIARGVDPTTREPVDTSLAYQAQKYLLERRYGTTPQAIHVEQRVLQLTAQVPQDAFGELTDEQLAVLEQLAPAGLLDVPEEPQ